MYLDHLSKSEFFEIPCIDWTKNDYLLRNPLILSPRRWSLDQLALLCHLRNQFFFLTK